MSIGINGTLYMAVNALSAQRAAIEVTGNNISNVNTPNYARQRANLVTALPLHTDLGLQGLGVVAQGIEQLRSALLDNQIPGHMSNQSYYEEKANLLAQVQTNIGQSLNRLDSLAGSNATSTGSGLNESLEKFFNSFKALSADPTSSVLRQQIILDAQNVATKLNMIGTALEDIQSKISTQISQNVTDINSALGNIATLNSQISAGEVGGVQRANDLRDNRQQLIENLSKTVDLYTQEESNGTVTIRLGNSSGPLLVSGVYSGNTASASTVKLAVSGAPPLLNIKGYTGGVSEVSSNLVALSPQPAKGILGAQIEIANTTIGDSSSGLVRDYNRIAAALASLVNTQHAAGYTLEGSPTYSTAGTSTFFDDNATSGDALGTVTAKNIQLNSAVATDITKIAASSIVGEPNNGTNAASIAALRDNTTGPSLGSVSISSYYLASVTSLGSSISATNSQASTEKLVNQQLSQQRDSVMGVSIDEETTNLMRFQHAFEASARLVSIVNDMMGELLNIGR